MKIGFYALVFAVSIVSCGPAAEDREKMHERAKVFQDSIATFIKNAMAEAEAPGPQMVPVQPAGATQATQAPQPAQPVSPGVDVNRSK